MQEEKSHIRPLRCWKGGVLVTCLMAITKFLTKELKEWRPLFWHIVPRDVDHHGRGGVTAIM